MNYIWRRIIVALAVFVMLALLEERVLDGHGMVFGVARGLVGAAGAMIIALVLGIRRGNRA